MLDSTVFDFPAKKVCLHLLHVEKDWVEFSAVHKSFNKDGPFGRSFQTICPFLMTMLKPIVLKSLFNKGTCLRAATFLQKTVNNF